jgi:hypothetical protein
MKAHILAAAALVAVATPALAQGIDSKHSPYPASAYAGYAGNNAAILLPEISTGPRRLTGTRVSTRVDRPTDCADIPVRRGPAGPRYPAAAQMAAEPAAPPSHWCRATAAGRDATRRPRRGPGRHIRPLQKRAAGR